VKLPVLPHRYRSRLIPQVVFFDLVLALYPLAVAAAGTSRPLKDVDIGRVRLLTFRSLTRCAETTSDWWLSEARLEAFKSERS
jgi:hypothetical protein